MKPRIKYTIGIHINKQGYYWSVKAANSRKTATTGETNVKKSHVIRMVKELFLAGFSEEFDIRPGVYSIFVWNEKKDQWMMERRLLKDFTK